jgi:hypothetical protein
VLQALVNCILVVRAIGVADIEERLDISLRYGRRLRRPIGGQSTVELLGEVPVLAAVADEKVPLLRPGDQPKGWRRRWRAVSAPGPESRDRTFHVPNPLATVLRVAGILLSSFVHRLIALTASLTTFCTPCRPRPREMKVLRIQTVAEIWIVVEPLRRSL